MLSRSRIVRLMEKGAVRSGGRAASGPKEKPVAGEVWQIVLPEAAQTDMRAEAIELDVVFEDADLIIVNKAAGMVVHPAPGSMSGTLVNALLHHCSGSLSGVGGKKRPGVVHRIDKDTTGLIVAAKTDRAHLGLAAQFADHSIERLYRAFVHGVPARADPRLAGLGGIAFEPGNVIRISGNLGRHKSDRKRMAVVSDRGRHAITRVRVNRAFGDAAALLDCWLQTGRTHQIRVHLAHAGHGLIGDQIYGGRRRFARSGGFSQAASAFVNGFPRQALHAAVLGFIHPVSGAQMRFERDLPDDLNALLEMLRMGRG